MPLPPRRREEAEDEAKDEAEDKAEDEAEDKAEDEPPPPGSSHEYRVSTITAVGALGVGLNLPVLAKELCIVEGEEETSSRSTTLSPVYMEYSCVPWRDRQKHVDHLAETSSISSSSVIRRGSKARDEVAVPGRRRRGVRKKKTDDSGEGGEKRMFDNQMTLVLQRGADQTQRVNIKVFANGRVQITGARTIKMARDAVADVRSLVFAAATTTKDATVTLASAAEASDAAFRVCLINSDARLPYAVKRAVLYRTMVTEERMFCSYEPCTYPGVKIMFVCDSAGVCRRGISPERGEVCIRCVVFRSGCVLLTGALTYAQLDGSYAFVMGLLGKHADAIAAAAAARPGRSEA